jgi:hypothetical protein
MNKFERQKNSVIQATQALKEHLSPPTVALVVFHDDGQPKEISSGTLVTDGTKVVVATCAHFLRDNHDRKLHVLDACGRESKVLGAGFRGGGKGDLLDVGWVQLEGIPIAQAIRVRRLARRQDEALDDLVLVAGSPASLIAQEPLRKQHLAIRTVFYTTEAAPDHHEPPHRLALDFPRGKNLDLAGGAFEDFAPHGMSGGGVWVCNFGDPERVWSADRAELFAIQIAWKERASVLITQPIEYWLDMIKTEIPDFDQTYGEVGTCR